MFELSDTDEDGCMNPQEILAMLQRVQRLFVDENSRIRINSQVLNNSVADMRAEQQFNLLMTTLRRQTIQKSYRERLKDLFGEQFLESAGTTIPNEEVDLLLQTSGMPLDAAKEFLLDLITLKEFLSAIRSSMPKLSTPIIPETLSL